MIININFDKKSLKEAINQVKKVKSKFNDQIPKMFIRKCLTWVKNKANSYLDKIDMSKNIINDIQLGWDISIMGNKGKLINTNNTSVYVEFGVGYVGEQNPHPNANETNYKYNIPTKRKDKEGNWRFRRAYGDDSIDINVGYYETSENDKGQLIKTKGYPPNLYLYNAIVDLMTTKAYEKLWKETLASKLK